jgi:hypothetical protein
MQPQIKFQANEFIVQSHSSKTYMETKHYECEPARGKKTANSELQIVLKIKLLYLTFNKKLN